MLRGQSSLLFFFNYTPTTEIYTLFPTRRSSDLLWNSYAERVAELLKPDGVLAGFFFYGQSRSEEHTSELQSRENLVCRLLLEKKKKKQNSLALRSKYAQVLHRARARMSLYT